ncbi:tail collar fiber protein [Pseudoalteromonas phage C5a]|uniref:Tail fiber protein n=1 Tax=Pseudoalteromonas phage C5a TaxID=1916107 RepID=A0A1L5C2D7_9CAUD|nr:tail collar fiber protein [Pseudoalteromonas phage C5a]APM00254.1 tail fiber protein [Pseudoalteromonas phage C5a]
MSQVVTNAGEALFAHKAQANEQLDIDTFIFAYVPGQDSQAPVDRSEGLPPTAQRVHTQPVQQVGRINSNTVVYSTVLNSLTGPFEFNWVGLYSSVNNTLVAISHVKSVNKTITELGNAGNTLNRNFAIEYSGISDITGITVAPETWQLDFSARLAGMDALTQNLAMDMNGRDWFIGDGFKVEPTANDDEFRVIAGVGYVHGMRVELEQDYVFSVQSYPQNVYVDVWFEGDADSAWKTVSRFELSTVEVSNYNDEMGLKHYKFNLALIEGSDVYTDLRVQGKISKEISDHVNKENSAHNAESINWNGLRTNSNEVGKAAIALKKKILTENDFNKTVETGLYLGFGDEAGINSSINAPKGSGNVRFSVFVHVDDGVIFQEATAGNQKRGLRYYRTAYVVSDKYEDALKNSNWNTIPTLDSPNTFIDEVDSTQSMINLEHYSDGKGLNSQTYGLDIHNNPGAKSAVVVHQYSDDTPAVWLDNTDDQPMVRINNTHNRVRNPDGPETSRGDFLELKTEGLTKLRLRHDFVFEANKVTPIFYGAFDGFAALQIQTPNGNLSDTLQIKRANTSNAGSAINVENSGGIGLRVNQTGAGLAAFVRSDQNTDVVQIEKNSNGEGDVLQIRNKGKGQSLRVEDSEGNTTFAVDNVGLINWKSDNQQNSVGESGSAAILPSAPETYLKIKAANGTVLLVPAYLQG